MTSKMFGAMKTKDGKIEKDMWLFYGWKESDGEAPQAKAFLLLKTY